MLAVTNKCCRTHRATHGCCSTVAAPHRTVWRRLRLRNDELFFGRLAEAAADLFRDWHDRDRRGSVPRHGIRPTSAFRSMLAAGEGYGRANAVLMHSSYHGRMRKNWAISGYSIIVHRKSTVDLW
ncbi:hypothetical protein RPC_0634 [Rhodopseudomonas palustris BisB18]|uniref:Uncharacterized protein n=1 Tax=Rhodopseudomonas palustris (strain BisB18) TaxID=316056 RepID=Q21BM9_RHOPB